jgi:hypothetical protein
MKAKALIECPEETVETKWFEKENSCSTYMELWTGSYQNCEIVEVEKGERQGIFLSGLYIDAYTFCPSIKKLRMSFGCSCPLGLALHNLSISVTSARATTNPNTRTSTSLKQKRKLPIS